MSINNIATYHHRRLTNQNSIAVMCLERLKIDRELELAPGYTIKNVKDIKSKVEKIKYFDENGNRTTRVAIAKKYKVHNKTVSNAFIRNEYDYVLAHKDLANRL